MVNRPDLVTVFMEVTWNLYQKDWEDLGSLLGFGFFWGERITHSANDWPTRLNFSGFHIW